MLNWLVFGVARGIHVDFAVASATTAEHPIGQMPAPRVRGVTFALRNPSLTVLAYDEEAELEDRVGVLVHRGGWLSAAAVARRSEDVDVIGNAAKKLLRRARGARHAIRLAWPLVGFVLTPAEACAAAVGGRRLDPA